MSQRHSPSEYTMLLRAHGLNKPGLGTAAVLDLMALQRAPIPRLPAPSHSGRKQTTLATLGMLIRHKLAEFNAGSYEITPTGTAWLAALSAADCLPKEKGEA